jgi:hypothetical protein
MIVSEVSASITCTVSPLSRSDLRVLHHDAAHDAFMKLPRHTRIREDEVQPVEGALRHPPQAWSLVAHREGVD